MKLPKKAIGVVASATMLLGMSAGAAFAEDLFGGDWYYGTNYATGNASSSYYHGSRWHWTSIGTSSGKYERSNASAGNTASTWLWRTPGSSVTFKAGTSSQSATR
ncbi:lactococcin 972 family bacteriocin [Schaalia sp. lx-260]|uniref:lactococcin 972 family bacteriocin n=1 Tax=Schaalia sp. lx-260 TaxID=2899082 RepID=UPI001E56B975|nr:lactococcin 972 family bacteriocin [Schaalia sp. lx-260]MCD4549512.1 lactococcin 972 family bacteriocin [Schaalia sp. lx-260]